MLPPPLRRLAEGDATVAVTGATGWFGRETLDLLSRALGPQAFRARVRGYASREREMAVAGVGTVAVRPLSALEPADLLLHHAFRTDRAVAPEALAGFVLANVEITTRVLETVATGEVRGVLMTSSGAARAPGLRTNPYGTLKALDELAFAEACRRVGATCVMPRVFAAAGPHLRGGYALGELIARAHQSRALELSAHGDVVRSYAGVEEVVLVALGELLDRRDARFDTAGEVDVELGELAHTVLRILGRQDLPIVRDRHPAAAPDVYVGDGECFRGLAARHGVVLRGLDALVAATAAGPSPSPSASRS